MTSKKPLFSSPAFKQAQPFLVATGVNKLGSVGLIFIPAYLIQIHLSEGISSWLVAIGAGASFCAPLLSGWIGDRFGAKRTILLAWAAGAVAFGAFAFSPKLPLALLALIVLARLSHAMFPPAGRFLIMSLVEEKHQREALGWGRTVNNLGQALAFAAGTIVGKLGLAPLFSVDSVTSLFGIYFLRKIPNAVSVSTSNPKERSQQITLFKAIKAAPISLWMVGGGIAVFQLLYELIEIGASSRLQLLYNNENPSGNSSGVAWFSFFMLINTILCGLLAIPATRYLTPGNWEMLIGLGLLSLGGVLFFYGLGFESTLGSDATRTLLPWIVGLSSLVFTAGEILFATTANFALMKLVPEGPYSMRVLSITITVQQIGKFIGASIALPLAVYGNWGVHSVVIATLIGLSLIGVAAGDVNRLTEK